jgi:hypothetical protein
MVGDWEVFVRGRRWCLGRQTAGSSLRSEWKGKKAKATATATAKAKAKAKARAKASPSLRSG